MATRCRNTGQLASKAAFGRLERRPGVMRYKRDNFIGVSLLSTPECTVECVQSGGDQHGTVPDFVEPCGRGHGWRQLSDNLGSTPNNGHVGPTRFE